MMTIDEICSYYDKKLDPLHTLLQEQLLKINKEYKIFDPQTNIEKYKDIIEGEKYELKHKDDGIIFKQMETGACYKNCDKLLQSKEIDEIAIGFALIDEIDAFFLHKLGFVQHCWGIKDGKIVETSFGIRDIYLRLNVL